MTIKPWLPSLLYLLALGIGGVLAFTHIPIHSQLHALLPSTENATQQALSDQLQSGQTSRMLLLGLQGATREVLGEANKQLAQAMRDSGRFVYVHNGEHSSLKNDQALLYRYRYLLSPSLHPFQFQGKAFQEALQRRVSDISNLLPLPIKQKILEDPTQAFPPYAQMLKGGNSLNTQHGVWFSAQKDLTLLVAETMAPGFDLDTQEDIQSLMTFQVEILRATLPGASALELLRTGSSLFAIQSRTLIQHDARWLSSLGTLGVVTLLFLTYRSAGLILLTMIPLATALLASSLAVYAVFGYLHGITLAFGATLIGVAIDYPIHLFTHLHPPDPPATTMKRIWPTIRLGALTTALGYGAMLLSGFPGLAQLGLFAMIGSLSAAATTRWILLFFIPPHHVYPTPWIAWVPHTTPWVSRLVALTILLAVGYLATSEKPFWESDIANLSPIPSNLKHLDSEMRQEVGAPSVRDFLIVMAPTPQAALEQTEDLQPPLQTMIQKGALRGYEMAATYLPSERTQRTRQAFLPESGKLEEALHHALEGLPLQPELFRPFLQAVEESKYFPPLTVRALKGTPLGTKIDSLLYPSHEQWVGVVMLQGVQNRHMLASSLEDISSGNVYYLDLKDETNRMVTQYRTEILKYLGLGMIGLLTLLGLNLRSFSGVMRTILPVAGALVLVLATLHLFNEALSLFHIASLLLVAGIGIDYVLFLSRHGNTPQEHETIISSVWVCSLTTILVFGVMAFSQTPVLHSIGLTTALGALFCLVMSLVYSRQNIPPVSSQP